MPSNKPFTFYISPVFIDNNGATQQPRHRIALLMTFFNRR